MGNGWNIPKDIVEMGEASGLSPRSTGGNIDYMEKRVRCPEAGADTYVCWLAAQSDAGSPASLKARADILVIPLDRHGEEDIDVALRIRCASAARAIKLMERIEHIYGKED